MKFTTQYLKWIKDNTIETVQDNGWTEISTPFMDRHNDGLIIYAKEDNGIITLSDDGYIIGDMELSGINIRRRMKSISHFMQGYGIDITDNNELQVNATIQNYPIKQHLLLQAMMAASDMFIPSTQTGTLFLDDVTNFFDKNNIIYTPDSRFQGKSGYIHKVDFVIPKTHKSPERFLYAINTPNVSRISATIFMWEDIQTNRPFQNEMIAILNDTKKIPTEAINAFSNYNALPIQWSKRETFIDTLRIA